MSAVKHGTESAYRYHGCRCPECRKGRADRARILNARKRKQRKPAPRPASFEHGTVSGYVYRGCRCQQCREAHTTYRRNGRPAKPRKPLSHGTISGYDRGCRCAPCRHAKSVYLAEWRLRKGHSTRSNTLTTTEAATPATDVVALLEARARALTVTIAATPRSAVATEARHRRAEVRDLLAHLTDEVTA